MANNNKPTKEVVLFHKLDITKPIQKEEKIEEKGMRKTIKNLSVLENGCVALKTSDIHFYQFTPERVNQIMGTSLKDHQELENFLQNADKVIIEKMIKNDNLIFNQKIEYGYVDSGSK